MVRRFATGEVLFFLICTKHFESFQASFDLVGQNMHMEVTITSLRLRV